MIRNTCVSGSMLSGIEIWPLFVHSTHRLPEIFSSDFIKVSLHIDMYMSRNIKVKIKIKLTNIFPENKDGKLTHNLIPDGNMILFTGGPVDWRACETWMGDIGYRGRGCVTKVGCVSIESATCIIEKGQLGSSNRVFN